ncbi:MAG: hypothetical protein K8L97_33600 [Anaerolineae bacterium]|nr:hypothetical protein [Anaerolineae bacterium]
MRKTVFALLLALLFIPAVVRPQDRQSVTCENYIADLENDLSLLNNRLNSFPRTAPSLRSDYAAWQEKRVAWQEITPPDCAVALHASVIAMYANLGDIPAWGLYLEYDPASTSGNRIVQESIERASLSIQSVAEASAAISGNEVNIEGVADSLEAIADRFENG